MKIVVGTTRPFHLFHLGRELANLGHDVTVFGYIPDRYVARYDLGKAKYVSLFTRLLPFSALALQKKSMALQRFATEKLLSLVDVEISRQMPDCDVYIGLSGMAVDSLSAAKKRGAFAICDRGSSHVITQKNAVQASASERLSEKYIERELFGYDEASFVAVPSIYAKQSFIENGVDESKLFYNNYGVDLTRFKNKRTMMKRSDDVVKIVFVGGWTYRKGCDLISSLIDLDSRIHVTHAGGAGDIPFPKSNRFKTFGHVANNKLPSLYADHDVFLLPSREDGFGMVLLEAMACGLPAVASRNSGGPDILNVLAEKKNISIVDELNPKGILEALLTVTSRSGGVVLDPNSAKHFTWSQYGKRYSDFISEVGSTKGL